MVEFGVLAEPEPPDRARDRVALDSFEHGDAARLGGRRDLSAAAASFDQRDPELRRREFRANADTSARSLFRRRRRRRVALHPRDLRCSALGRLVVEPRRETDADLREVVLGDRRHVDELVARVVPLQVRAVRRHDLLVRRYLTPIKGKQLAGASWHVSELVPFRVDVGGHELIVVTSALAREHVEQADRHLVVGLELRAPPTCGLVVDRAYDHLVGVTVPPQARTEHGSRQLLDRDDRGDQRARGDPARD